MTPRQIAVDEARTFFADPSQQVMGITPDNLPDEGFEYWACGPVCLAFHAAMWPGVWGVHIAVKPEGSGRVHQHATAILRAFWSAHEPHRVVAWIASKDLAVRSLAVRCGFTSDGAMPGISMKGWAPCQLEQS